jgi:hypothetical protein
MAIKSELPEGYELKHCQAGWFVDGKNGYMVTPTYYRDKAQAVVSALFRIEEYSALPRHERPSWFIPLD